MTEEQRARISAAMKGKRTSLGYKHTLETKLKIAEARRGHRWTDEQKANLSWRKGEKHPRYQPHLRSREWRTFTSEVHRLTKKTYAKYKAEINPADHPRTLCGVPGGYQLDHKVSIKQAYREGWLPEQVASKENLQILPWKANLSKSAGVLL